MKQLYEIMEFAFRKHDGQKDKAGMPYILHIVAVSLGVKDDKEKAVALLHDVLEDTDTTPQELLDFGIDKDVVDAVVLLTKDNHEDYSLIKSAYPQNFDKKA